MADEPFSTALARQVWESRYRWRGAPGGGERDIQATWQRVAAALASVEPHARDAWTARFRTLLDDFRFLPGGRVLAGAGTSLPVTLFNCFVGTRPDGTRAALLACLDELSRVTLAGGGIGTDYSRVPPADAAQRAGSELRGGSLPLLALWDALCAALSAGRIRHGAMMATLACDHPDLPAFMAAKRTRGELRRFTLSVLVTDAFLAASRNRRTWRLAFPSATAGAAEASREVDADALWLDLVQHNLAAAEPGLLFIDTIRRLDPLAYAEEIATVNPCGEVPLPVHGACDLGSFNLTRFVRDAFTPAARFDLGGLRARVPDAVRLLDNVYELSAFPTEHHREVARNARRIGLGITGLADTLVMLGLPYDSPAAREFAGGVMRELCVAAYRASVALAREKGAFPLFHGTEHARGAFVSRLPRDLRADITRYGLRNSHLLAIAPTGSISLLANGVSSGLEPLPALHVNRRVRLVPDAVTTLPMESHALARFRARFGAAAPLPTAFMDAGKVSPEAQLLMQAALQQHVDNAIAKTISLPAGYPAAALDGLLRNAHALGLKGCAVYRPGSRHVPVVAPADDNPAVAAADRGPTAAAARGMDQPQQ